LYRHIKKLLDGGMIEVAETHAVKGTPEKTYRLLQTPNITVEDVIRLVSLQPGKGKSLVFLAG
jgi:predicted ArsR family transcriptional regulator